MADVTNSKLFQIDTGILNIQDACIVIIKTEWNADVVDELEKGCRSVLTKHGITNVVTITVPGAVEIPFAIKTYWLSADASVGRRDKPNAFVALGCVVRGGTPHFDYVCDYVTNGILQLNLSLPVPSIFGILTVDNDGQARERIGGSHGHKGEEAAITAMKMITFSRSL
jgi:6,7-dimethyl-8-ribityllumazine synthase